MNKFKVKKTVREIAADIHNASVSYPLASAMYGLTSILYERDKQRFHSDTAKEIQDIDEKIQKIYFNDPSVDASELPLLRDKLNNIKCNLQPMLKFFYIVFDKHINKKANLTIPTETPQDEEHVKYEKNVYYISLSEEYRKIFEETPHIDKQSVKYVQRRETAHELAHAIFMELDGADCNKSDVPLDTDDNAELFADYLLNERQCYINGMPAKARVNRIFEKSARVGIIEEFMKENIDKYDNLQQDILVNILSDLAEFLAKS
jgi:hypothetical protein